MALNLALNVAKNQFASSEKRYPYPPGGDLEFVTTNSHSAAGYCSSGTMLFVIETDPRVIALENNSGWASNFMEWNFGGSYFDSLTHPMWNYFNPAWNGNQQIWNKYGNGITTGTGIGRRFYGIRVGWARRSGAWSGSLKIDFLFSRSIGTNLNYNPDLGVVSALVRLGDVEKNISKIPQRHPNPPNNAAWDAPVLFSVTLYDDKSFTLA